mmetsp:Transcript_25743/g.51228  ORF Transcript_25743/g.51228 Transcript_25743/m.51228 type:complete len:204 (+) Transcript_25743:213-824(+)
MSGLRHILAKQRGAAAGAALAAIGFGTWASIVTANDDWDDYFPPAPPVGGAFDNGQKEKIVILGSGWAGLNALRKCAGPDKDVVIVSPRPHFLYTPLLAGSAVGTVTLRSACDFILHHRRGRGTGLLRHLRPRRRSGRRRGEQTRARYHWGGGGRAGAVAKLRQTGGGGGGGAQHVWNSGCERTRAVSEGGRRFGAAARTPTE